MMTSKLLRIVSRNRRINGVRHYARNHNPFTKTLNILANDMPSFLSSKDKPMVYPEHADVVIIGGGFIGSAVAYWLKKRTAEGLSVVVLEKDFTVSRKSIPRQFSDYNILLEANLFFVLSISVFTISKYRFFRYSKPTFLPT